MISVVAEGIYDKLVGDATLMAAIDAVYRMIAVQGAVLPYVTFDLLSDAPVGTFASQTAIEDSTWWFNVFTSVGSKAAGDIAQLVMDVLDDAVLTVTGYSSLKCVREFINPPIYDPETEVFQVPLRYRVLVDKN